MSKLTVEDTSLTAVADAIRTKGGTTDALVFPDEFVSAIEDIQGGISDLSKDLIDGNIKTISAEQLKGCTQIRNDCFSNYGNLMSIVFAEGIAYTGDRSFYNCYNLESVVLPESITRISYNSFALCSKLTSIIIPKNVTYLGNQAFYYDKSLHTVEMKPTTPPTHPGNAFKDCTALTKIIVPAGSLSAYQSATNWSAHADLMVEATE